MPFCRKERFATNWFVNSFLYQNKRPCTYFFSTDGSFFSKVTGCFEESDVSFLGKQRVVFLQPTCRFVRKNSRCDFAGCYYGLITALYFQNQCVKRLSVFLGSNYVHFQNRCAKKNESLHSDFESKVDSTLKFIVIFAVSLII